MRCRRGPRSSVPRSTRMRMCGVLTVRSLGKCYSPLDGRMWDVPRSVAATCPHILLLMQVTQAHRTVSQEAAGAARCCPWASMGWAVLSFRSAHGAGINTQGQLFTWGCKAHGQCGISTTAGPGPSTFSEEPHSFPRTLLKPSRVKASGLGQAL